MNTKWITAATVTLAGTLAAGAASAQEKDRATSDAPRSLDAATHSVELTVGTGYAQGFGNVGSSQPSLTDLGVAGGAVQVGAGYRLIPQLTLGMYGTGAMFARGDQVDPSARLYSASAGVQADWHFLPAGREFDPWIGLGTGWRGYWAHSDQGTTSLQGLELARLEFGVDYRIDRAVAISPVVGADLSTFLTQSTPANDSFHNVASPELNTFVFGGIQGRFDIPTQARPASSVASR
jgi:hypothetical protein